MFGMLDYRAHKLYLIMFFIPNFLVIIFEIFGIPLINYSIGLLLSDVRVFQIIISLISMIIFELIWAFIAFAILGKIFSFIFLLFVDVIPHNGRTKDQALAVTWNGDRAIRTIEIDKNPSTWTDELINEFPKNDWVANLFFRENVIKRCEAVKEHYASLPADTPYTEYEASKALNKKNLHIQWKEKYLTDKTYRLFALSFGFFLYLLITHPSF